MHSSQCKVHTLQSAEYKVQSAHSAHNAKCRAQSAERRVQSARTSKVISWSPPLNVNKACPLPWSCFTRFTNTIVSIQTIFNRYGLENFRSVWKVAILSGIFQIVSKINLYVSDNCSFIIAMSMLLSDLFKLDYHHLLCAHWTAGGPLGDWGTFATIWKLKYALHLSLIWAIWAIREGPNPGHLSSDFPRKSLTNQIPPAWSRSLSCEAVWSNRRIKSCPRHWLMLVQPIVQNRKKKRSAL